MIYNIHKDMQPKMNGPITKSGVYFFNLEVLPDRYKDKIFILSGTPQEKKLSHIIINSKTNEVSETYIDSNNKDKVGTKINHDSLDSFFEEYMSPKRKLYFFKGFYGDSMNECKVKLEQWKKELGEKL